MPSLPPPAQPNEAEQAEFRRQLEIMVNEHKSHPSIYSWVSTNLSMKAKIDGGLKTNKLDRLSLTKAGVSLMIRPQKSSLQRLCVRSTLLESSTPSAVGMIMDLETILYVPEWILIQTSSHPGS